MANNVGEWSATAASNTSLGAVSLQENIMLVNAVNNAFRELMAQVATGISNGDFGTAVPFTAASASAAASLDFAEDTDNGTNKVTVTAPATLGSDVTVTLPDATGTLALAANVLALSGGTMTGTLTTNGQVAFPATANPSADANTLDDYEEGTWTPVDSSGAGLSFTAADGLYTKIGNVMNAFARAVYPTTANGSDAVVGGLPFTVRNNQAARSGFVSYTNETTLRFILVAANSTTMSLAAAGAFVTNATMSTNEAHFTAIYPVA